MDKPELPPLRGVEGKTWAEKHLTKEAQAELAAQSKPMSFHELEAEMMGPPDATVLARGVTLFTVDGSRIGNAIVVKKAGQTRDWRHMQQVGKGEIGPDPKGIPMLDVWLIETDFGNSCKMTEIEIFSHFVLGKQHDYDKWWDDRLTTIQQTVERS